MTRRSERSQPFDDEMFTAYHEAGHAVMAYELRVPFGEVSIVPSTQRGSKGHLIIAFPTWLKPDIDNGGRARSYIEARIMATLAGALAQKLYRRSRDRIGAQDDEYQALKWADCQCGTAKEANAYLKWLRVRAENTVRSGAVRAAIIALAKELKAKRTLGPRAVRRVIKDAKDRYYD